MFFAFCRTRYDEILDDDIHVKAESWFQLFNYSIIEV